MLNSLSFLFRHQGPEDALAAGEITDMEYDNLSRANVEKWVSSHIVPVRFLSQVYLSKHEKFNISNLISFRSSSFHLWTCRKKSPTIPSYQANPYPSHPPKPRTGGNGPYSMAKPLSSNGPRHQMGSCI
jgi:hypothetical protein